MRNKKTQRIVIVGGGTAGWLTAAKLAKRFNCRYSQSVQVTLIESPDIPTIGVGEGTWPTMRKTLMELGVSESLFMAKCSATFKQGTRFNDWLHEPNESKRHHYYHMFSSTVDPADFNLAPYWCNHFVESVSDTPLSYADMVTAQAAVCREGLAPKLITHREYDGVLNYAYHLDAGKFAELLQIHATEVLGVVHIRSNVTQVALNDVGDIHYVKLNDEQTIEGDFFIDCSGFRCLLLGEAMGIEFMDMSHQLLTDRAIAIQVPYEDETQNIACQTNSTAQTAGWIWDIGLYNRRGTGHVYSSHHLSDDHAEEQLRSYIGDVSAELSAKMIKMRIGYREKFWHKNCVAIGMSAAFIEPLEASAIFLIEAAGNMLCELIPETNEQLKSAETIFNRSMLQRWLKTRDFIKMHYLLSRRSSDFWRDNQSAETVSDSLQAKLERWRYEPMSKYEFDSVFEPFPQESYQYVFYGMLNEYTDFGTHYFEQQKARSIVLRTLTAQKELSIQLMNHRDLLTKVYHYGFQKI